MTTITLDAKRRRVTIGAWTVRAAWVRRASDSGHGNWSALVEIRRGVNLLVQGEDRDQVSIELWAGEPDASDGLAVMCEEGGSLLGVARIPCCACGERGCGNVGIQLVTDLDASSLPKLVDALRELPDSSENPHRGRTWDGKMVDGQPS